MGEYLVGAYLRLIEGCTLISYDQKASEVKGEFGEIDVVAINGSAKTVYLCEVVTHLQGMLYGGGNQETLRRLKGKFLVSKEYGETSFPDFKRKYMLWSPYVPKGRLTSGLEAICAELEMDIEFIINEVYTGKVRELQKKARTDTKDRGEPFYRALQIIEYLRE